ncbi:uncharacterized protein [Lepeophtheirus salmonis]|uniref:uncharacterized protein n=1 Tax=Lepeophtheirus salmonis TaxID=72036 RepID=UPI001AE570A0|nr:pupal cuticle protein 36-like [Lepeophtheirus salmonis]
MKSFVLYTLLLSSALVIDASVLHRRFRRDHGAPLSSYGAGPLPFGQASSHSHNHVAAPFNGAGSSSGGSAGGAGSSFSGSPATGVAASGPAAPVVAIISESSNAPGTLGDNGDFDTAFESENGIKQQAVGSTVTIGEESVVTMKGSYEYVGADGQTYVVDWIADENGFQPSAAHLPKDVPIPFPEIAEAVEAQIAFAAQEDAAGGSIGNGGSAVGFGGSVATGSAGGFGGSTGAGGFQQSFGASGNNPSVAPLSSYGRK